MECSAIVQAAQTRVLMLGFWNGFKSRLLCEISRFPEMKHSGHCAGEFSLEKPVYSVVIFSRA